jgi:hypothetical protein
MEPINKNVILNLAWFVVVIIVAAALCFFFFRVMRHGPMAMTPPPSDMVATQELTHGSL